MLRAIVRREMGHRGVLAAEDVGCSDWFAVVKLPMGILHYSPRQTRCLFLDQRSYVEFDMQRKLKIDRVQNIARRRNFEGEQG